MRNGGGMWLQLLSMCFLIAPAIWRVFIIGSQANDRWEMKITGPNGFERSYTLEGTAGEHEPHAVAAVAARMVAERS
jgi:hypothetical protein